MAPPSPQPVSQGFDYFNQQDVVNAPTGWGDNAPSAPPLDTLGRVWGIANTSLAPEDSNPFLQEALRPINYVGAGGGFAGLARGALGGIGGRLGAEYAPQLLPEDAPDWQRTAAGVAGGLVGGGIGGLSPEIAQGGKRLLGAADRALNPSELPRIEYGRTPQSDSLFTAGPQGEVVGPTGNVAELRLGREPVMGEDVNAGLRRTAYGRAQQEQLAAEEQAAFRDAGDRAISGAVPDGGTPPLGGGSGASDAEFARLTATANAEKAATGAVSAETHDALMNLLGERIGATPTAEQAAAREAFYRDPANLGGGQGLSAEQQANVSGTVQRAGQLNTVRDSLANARAQEMQAAREQFAARGDAQPTNALSPAERAQQTYENAQNEWARLTQAKQVYDSADLSTHEGVMAARAQLRALGVPDTWMDFNVTQALADARTDLSNATKALDSAQPTALDKVIGRNADALPEPNRTQPPPGYLDRFRQPPAGGAEVPGEPPLTPFSLRPEDARVPKIEPRAEPFPDLSAEQEIAARVRLGDNPFGFTPEEIASGHAAEVLHANGGMPPPDGKTAKALQRTAEALNLWRTIKTAWDVSAPGRQGIMLAAGHPREFFGNMPQMVKAFANKETAEAFDAALHQSEHAGLWRESGLYVAPLDGTKIGLREEAFMSRAARYFPGVERSERAYINYLNGLRTQVFDSMWGKLPEAAQTAENGQRIARWVNTTTGRGTISQAMEDWAAVANGVLFSPRFMISRFESNGLGAVEIGRLAKQGLTRQALDPVSKQIANDYLKFIGATAGALVLAKTAGADVAMNPLSSEFGQVQVGNTRYDLTGGNATLIRYIAQEIAGKRQAPDAANVTDYPRSKTATNFMRSKLSPVAGLLWDATIGQGRTPGGLKLTDTNPANVRDVLLDEFAPMIVNDLTEAARQNHYGLAGAALGLPAIGGIGVNTYDTSKSGTAKKALLPKLSLPKTTLPKTTLPKLPGYAQGTGPGLSYAEAAALPGRAREPEPPVRMRKVKLVTHGKDGKISKVVEYDEPMT